MSAYIVSGGTLMEISCPTTLNRSTEQATDVIPTFGGKRKAFIRKGGRRDWSIEVDVATPEEVSNIETVARQVGSYGWYGPDAVIGNLLSPQASAFDVTPERSTATGLVQLPDGMVANTVAASGTIRVGTAHGAYEMVPIRPGTPVAVGAWGLGGVRFQGYWRDATGAAMTTYLVSAVTHSGWKWRSSKLTPPSGAAFIELQLFGGSQYALPSVSWGTTARPELGTGCPKALIHSPSHSPYAVWDGANWSDSSYTVTEIG